MGDGQQQRHLGLCTRQPEQIDVCGYSLLLDEATGVVVMCDGGSFENGMGTGTKPINGH